MRNKFREFLRDSFVVSCVIDWCLLLTYRGERERRERSIVHVKKSRWLLMRGLLMRMDFGPDAQSDRPPRGAAARRVGTRSKGVETFQDKLGLSGNLWRSERSAATCELLPHSLVAWQPSHQGSPLEGLPLCARHLGGRDTCFGHVCAFSRRWLGHLA